MTASSPVILPPLAWRETPNQSSRGGNPVRLFVVHRWGGKPVPDEHRAYLGNIEYMCSPAAQVSAHIVYGGGDENEATQLVAYGRKAWTEAAYNSVAESVESADDIWFGMDAPGFRQLARIVAFRCHARGLPAVWIHGAAVDDHRAKGVCRHADLGQAGGGHTQCPTTDLALWEHFMEHVRFELRRGGFRKTWGKWW